MLALKAAPALLQDRVLVGEELELLCVGRFLLLTVYFSAFGPREKIPVLLLQLLLFVGQA